MEASIKTVKVQLIRAEHPFRRLTLLQSQMETLKANQQAYMTQLMDQELLFKSNTFTSFVVTWLIRFNDPVQKHPKPTVELPLPKEVSRDFRILPEYILDNVIEYYVFLTRCASFALSL